MLDGQIGDKVVWAEIEFSQHYLEVFFFGGTITNIRSHWAYECTPDLAGSARGAERPVSKEAVWTKHGECRVWTLGKLENMKRDLARMFNDKIKSLTPKEST